jgi:hypothetical protein
MHQTQLSHNYRSDVDGLRALAAVSVVIFHAFAWLIPGGFGSSFSSDSESTHTISRSVNNNYSTASKNFVVNGGDQVDPIQNSFNSIVPKSSNKN